MQNLPEHLDAQRGSRSVESQASNASRVYRTPEDCFRAACCRVWPHEVAAVMAIRSRLRSKSYGLGSELYQSLLRYRFLHTAQARRAQSNESATLCIFIPMTQCMVASQRLQLPCVLLHGWPRLRTAPSRSGERPQLQLSKTTQQDSHHKRHCA